MTRYVALLRAVNVGGTGKLPMAELKAMCEFLQFTDVHTYIASGNVIFKTSQSADQVQHLLEAQLLQYAGKPVGVHIRSEAELEAVLKANPYPDAPDNRNMVIFLNAAPPIDTFAKVTGQHDEKISLGLREIYVHYGQGMGQSKLKIPAAQSGTARNLNTVAKLVAMARSHA